MPRPRKGDRVELLTRPERIVSDTIKQQAAERGMSVSQYVADLLAIQAGHPELVRELDKGVLPLAM
ncbi:MAG: toxin-antitoxin system [Mycobacterium sp.]|nr:MAG: toxin-antitoxin system [Mycobacterium sp.]